MTLVCVGFALTDALFGGDILPMLGSGPNLGSGTLANMSDPNLFNRNLRFSPASPKVQGSKIYYQIDDNWIREFVEQVAAGNIETYLGGKQSGSILLLPDTINAAEYRPPTAAEVAASCYRPPPASPPKKDEADQ